FPYAAVSSGTCPSKWVREFLFDLPHTWLRGLPERLAEIFLVQAAPTAGRFSSIVSLNKQIASIARLSGSNARSCQTHPLRQRQAKCLILNTSPKTFGVRLQNMGRWRAVHWNADAAVVIEGDGKFCLYSRKRHGNAFVPHKKWFFRQFVYCPF